MARKLAAGNWKMNGLRTSLDEAKALAELFPEPKVEILLCPPATLIMAMSQALEGSKIDVGGQDCHTRSSGAHTGDISAEMLADSGCDYVILGHSERRADHGESDGLIAKKTISATMAGLAPIVCVGETLAERESGNTLEVIRHQLSASLPDAVDFDKLVIAYEPVWAIGTGKVPTLDQIAEVHDDMRDTLSARYGTNEAHNIPLLYGGSVKPGNAAEIFATSNVNGALVGGASLKAADFAGIVTALEEA